MDYRGKLFEGADFTGAVFRDCELTNVKIADSWLIDVDLSGELRNVVVNDVDVTAYVEGVLDERHPERVQLRRLGGTAAEYQALWATIERIWDDTVTRAGALPEATLQQRVGGEWSFVETLRHLVCATDLWAARTILDQPRPFHRLGLPSASYPPADAAALGLDVAATPGYAEVLAARAERRATVRAIVAQLTDAELERRCTRAPAPGYPEEPRTVGKCLRVVFNEEIEHHRYAVRDLATLETSG
jgi:uncharacterized damage-inducible protein DinB